MRRRGASVSLACEGNLSGSGKRTADERKHLLIGQMWTPAEDERIIADKGNPGPVTMAHRLHGKDATHTAHSKPRPVIRSGSKSQKYLGRGMPGLTKSLHPRLLDC